MPPKALLFDLDDTLLETSRLLVPAAHREAAEAMVRAGLPATVDDALAVRLRLASERPREDVNLLVAQAFGVADPDIVEAGRRAFYHRDVGPLELEPEIAALLTRLRQHHLLFLVTVGSPATQLAKVRALGLEPWFSAIVYLDHQGAPGKEDAFRELLTRYGLEPAQCVVIGDRPDAEIAAGNRLGMHTVRLWQGEHRSSLPHHEEEHADRDVHSLLEIESVLQAWHGDGS